MIKHSRFCMFIVLFVLTQSISGQYLDSLALAHVNLRSIGPAGMSGRVTSIDCIVNQPSNIIVGTASGGVWKSSDGGVSWKPIFDQEATQSIGCVKINQANPDIIWVGTGEGNPRNSHNSGKGLYKSIDGGKTWTCMGLEETKLIHRIILDPTNDEVAYVGAMGSAWGDSKHRGVYKTVDGGKSWNKILYQGPGTGVADMVMDPSNPNKLLVALWEFRRTPWDFNSGGKSSGIYVTYNGGDQWRKVTEKKGLPKGDLGRIGLAFATNKPEIVYALVESKKNGLYKSIDGGHHWKLVNTENIGNRPFYYSEIYVDPSNENRIFNLWSYVSLSEDGGRSFKTIMDYGNNIHPDHHAMWINPKNPNHIINGNDGGLNISHDGGQNWHFASNLPVGQFYHVNYDMDWPYNVYGGMQDNGSWIGPSSVLKRGGIRNYDWQEIYFGDGFDVVPDPSNSRFGYAMSQGGNVTFYDRQTGKTTYIKPVHPEGKKLRFNWNAAIAQDPFDMNGIFFGSQHVHYSSDKGNSWVLLSPDLTTNDTSKQKQALSGGLTKDVTNAENHTTILCITPNRSDSLSIWVGTDDGQLQVTTNGGKSWNEISNRLPGYSPGSWIPQIEQGNSQNEFYVVVNDYRRNNWSAQLYYTKNHGLTFEQIADDNDVGSFITSVTIDPDNDNLIFMGADDGLYVSINKGRDWQKWLGNFPSVQVRDLKIHPREGDLIVGTFGRGIYILDNINFLRALASNNELDKFDLFDPQPSYLCSMRSYDGIRFIGQGEFVGQNRSWRAASITYWNEPTRMDADSVNQQTEIKKEKAKKVSKGNDSKKDKIKIVVFNESLDTIRSFSVKAKEGFNKINWNLTKNGIHMPSWKAPKKDADPPRGRLVLPGRYLVKANFKEHTDSVWVVVYSDPRIDFNYEQAKIKSIFLDSIDSQIKEITKGVDQLKSAKKSIELSRNLWTEAADTIRKAKNEVSNLVAKKVDSLLHLILVPQDLKGYHDRSKYLINQLYTVRGYLNANDGPPGPNAMTALNNFQIKARPVLMEINDFFESEWPVYMQEIMSYKPQIFESTEPLKLPR